MKSIFAEILFFAIVPLSLFATGCGPAQPQVVQPADTRDEDTATIQALSKSWSGAEAAKDLPKCLSFYADDGQRMSSGSYTAGGQEDLRREWEKILAEPGTSTWTPVKIEVARSSDIAYETGTTETKSLDKNKQPVTTTGKYVHVWEKQDDGKWKVVEDIENTDK